MRSLARSPRVPQQDAGPRRRPPAVAPWVRTRLRHSRGAALALTLLLLVSTFLATALPLALDRGDDRALRQVLERTPPTSRAVEARLDLVGQPFQPLSDSSGLSPQAMTDDQAAAQQLIGPPLGIDPAARSYGVHTMGGQDVVTDPGLPRIDGPPPTAALAWQPDQARHLRLTAGRLPTAAKAANASTGRGGALEIAVSTETAATMKLHLGQVLHLQAGTVGPVLLTVVGLYRPTDPADAYWSGEPGLIRPAAGGVSGGQFWHFEGLVAQDGAVSIPAMASVDAFDGGIEGYWWYPLAPGSLPAHRIPAARTELAGLLTGPAGNALQQQRSMVLSSPLSTLLDRFSTEDSALDPVLTVGVAGTVGVGVAVLLMAAGLAAERRRAELALLRARGGSMGALSRRLLGETLVCTTTGAALGAALAFQLLPTERRQSAALAATAVWVLGTAAVPLRGVLGHRRLRPGGRGADLLTARPSRRRTVAELSVLVVAAAAVTAVRRQGLSSGGGVDPLLSGAPLLLGLAGALLLVRAYPWPLRALARPSARRGGPVGFLGLARAGRGSAGAALLPLLALLLALSVAAFGAEILGGVSAGRDQAALLQTGADAQVAGSFAPLPTALVDAVRRSPGVGSVLALRHNANEPLNDQGPGANFDLYGIDPAPYLRLSRQDGTGGFDPALLDYRGSGPIPVLASPDLAATAGSAPIPMDDAFGKYTVRIMGTVPGTPAQEAGGFMLVADAALDTLPRPHDPMARNPGTLLLGGRVDGDALRAAVQRTSLGQPVTVLVRTEQLAALADSPQQSAVESVYLATIAAAGLLSVLAVLLALLQAAPGRSALLARLRTMGLTPGQGYRLILVEALPPVLTAVVAGTLLGLAAIPLFGPSVDLATLIGPVDPGLQIATGLQARALPLLGPAAALLLIAVGVVAVEAAVVGRRQIGTELRAGDQR